jgi:putative FmdB family regulatory protein
MPRYDLICDCGHSKEQDLKLDEKEPVCDKCGQRMKKAMSAPAFILKGNGWYKDGYGLHSNKEKKNGK